MEQIFRRDLLLVLLFYGWQVLSRVTILGVSHTAPFSPWSFGDYLSRMLPLLWIGGLFFLTFFTSGKARRAAVLTDAAPMAPRRYALARCAAALAGTALLALACSGGGRRVLRLVLRLVRLGRADCSRPGHPGPAPGVRPGQRLAAGAGPALAALCVDAPPLCLAALPLPEALGLWNGSLFTQYPLTLGSLDPAFSLPAAVLLVQCALLAAGIVLLALPPRRRHVE